MHKCLVVYFWNPTFERIDKVCTQRASLKLCATTFVESTIMCLLWDSPFLKKSYLNMYLILSSAQPRPSVRQEVIGARKGVAGLKCGFVLIMKCGCLCSFSYLLMCPRFQLMLPNRAGSETWFVIFPLHISLPTFALIYQHALCACKLLLTDLT